MMSILAYEGVDAVRDMFPKSRVHEVSELNTRAIIVVTGSHADIAFEGTNPTEIQDIFDDMSCSLVSCHGLGVHEGFHDHLMRVWDRMLAILVESGVKSVAMTGHSLGGAVAAIAAYKLCLHEVKAVTLTTFGSPASGGPEFCNAIASLVGDTERHVNNNDIFPRIVPIGYAHFDTLYYHTHTGKTLIDPPWWKVAVDRLAGRVAAIRRGLTDGLSDHAMLEYLRAVG